MILLDLNVVLAAHRADHPHHERLEPWFDDLTAGDDPFWVPDVVWSGFVRLSTNRRIFPVPTPVDDVFGFLRAVRSLPNHMSLVPTDRHLELFESLCRDAEATGDLVPDAYLAALALDHGCELVSFDRDFARFPGLRWRLPDEG
jgi:toxin-antitoxin system PIN domain toxin